MQKFVQISDGNLRVKNAPKFSSKQLNNRLTKPNSFWTIIGNTDNKTTNYSSKSLNILKSAKIFLERLNTKEDTTKFTISEVIKRDALRQKSSKTLNKILANCQNPREFINMYFLNNFVRIYFEDWRTASLNQNS